MKSRTLKSYCKNKFDQYFEYNYKNEKKYHWNIRKLIQKNNDIDLAILAQSKYYANNQIETASKLFKFTKEKYENQAEFLNSKNKYVIQYNLIMKNRKFSKNKYKRSINIILNRNGKTLYYLHSNYGFNKSKLYSFFKHGELNKFSILTLRKIYLSAKQLDKK